MPYPFLIFRVAGQILGKKSLLIQEPPEKNPLSVWPLLLEGLFVGPSLAISFAKNANLALH